MAEKKIITCPICHKRVGLHDGRTETNVICNCARCRRQIIYKVLEDKVVVKDIPPRATASGKTFY